MTCIAVSWRRRCATCSVSSQDSKRRQSSRPYKPPICSHGIIAVPWMTTCKKKRIGWAHHSRNSRMICRAIENGLSRGGINSAIIARKKATRSSPKASFVSSISFLAVPTSSRQTTFFQVWPSFLAILFPLAWRELNLISWGVPDCYERICTAIGGRSIT